MYVLYINLNKTGCKFVKVQHDETSSDRRYITSKAIHLQTVHCLHSLINHYQPLQSVHSQDRNLLRPSPTHTVLAVSAFSHSSRPYPSFSVTSLVIMSSFKSALKTHYFQLVCDG